MSRIIYACKYPQIDDISPHFGHPEYDNFVKESQQKKQIFDSKKKLVKQPDHSRNKNIHV